jgi:hypothetical protein
MKTSYSKKIKIIVITLVILLVVTVIAFFTLKAVEDYLQAEKAAQEIERQAVFEQQKQKNIGAQKQVQEQAMTRAMKNHQQKMWLVKAEQDKEERELSYAFDAQYKPSAQCLTDEMKSSAKCEKAKEDAKLLFRQAWKKQGSE